MKKKKNIIIGILVCILAISIPVAAVENSSRRTKIKSSGNINFDDGEVYFASSDLLYLADEIDNLEDTYKQTAVTALNDIGTYFLADGTAVHNSELNEIHSEEDKSEISFGKITEGIRKSQSLDSLLETQVTDRDGNLLYYKDEEAQANLDIYSLTTEDTGFPAFYQPANANNLSAGTAAWVDGTLIKGNGSDNAAYYNQGVIDGMTDTLDNINISYTYHVHEGTAGVIGGCYDNVEYQRAKHCECTGSGNGCCAHPSWQHGPSWCNAVIKYITDYKIDIACGKTEDTVEYATIIY